MAKAYALRVKPELSVSDAKKAEQQLNSRFKKVADKYGDEMQKQNSKTADDFSTRMKGAFGKLKSGWAIAAGALAGIVGSVLSNPIDEADARLNEFLSRMDNMQTRAQQWGVAPEKYLVASEIARTAGAEGVFDQALLRIAERLEMARTGEDPTLKEFLGANDIVDAFYQLAQTWQNMDPQSRAASMADILGARQANQFAELIQTDWVQRMGEVLGNIRYSQLGPAIRHAANLEEQQAIGQSQLRFQELMRITSETSDRTIRAQLKVDATKQREALDDIKNYESLALAKLAEIELAAKTMDAFQDKVLEYLGKIAKEFGITLTEEEAKNRATFEAIATGDSDARTAALSKIEKVNPYMAYKLRKEWGM